MRFLRGEITHDGASTELVDAGRATHASDPGFTHPAEAPDERIDYVYVVPGTVRAGSPRSCTVVLGTPTSGIRASDHLGVMCDGGP